MRNNRLQNTNYYNLIFKILNLNKFQQVMERQTNDRARRNWQKVRNIILNKKIAKTKANLYHLFRKDIQTVQTNQIIIYTIDKIRIPIFCPIPNTAILANGGVNQQIDTTGSWVWEAQQILAYFLMKSYESIKPNKILELGAGCSGFAGILLSKLLIDRGQTKFKCQITDGKMENIPFLQKSIQLNNLENELQGNMLMWGEQQQMKNQYDLIIAADCLFFEKYHKQLIFTLTQNLSKSGQAFFVNPKRGKSMQNFLDLIQLDENLEYQKIQFYDEEFIKKQSQIKNSVNFNQQEQIFHFIRIIHKSKQQEK